MKLKNLLAAAALAVPLAALPTVAYAQDEEAAGPIDVSAEVAVLSDYRFRGLSLSAGEPELTASLSVSHESGLYASAWVSNVNLGLGSSDEMEMDWTAGYSKDIGNINVNVGAVYYTYLNHSGYNYIEGFGSVGTKVGPAEVRVGAAYAPKQDNLGGMDNTYVYISGNVPVKDTPFSFHGSFGYEDGAFAVNKKDWIFGASVDLGGGLSATVDYVDTAHDVTGLGGPTAVASLKFGF